MIRLQIGDDQQIEQPTSEAIADAIAALDAGEQPFLNLVREGEGGGFAKAIRLQRGLFLLEYSDIYGHLAADEPLDASDLADVLNAYAGGDVAWVQRFSWAPVEL